MRWKLLNLSTVLGCSLDVLCLLDTSVGSPVREPGFTRDILAALDVAADRYPRMRVATASFTDKPAPFVGVGVFGGYPWGYTADFCMDLQSGFAGAYTTSRAKVENALSSLRIGNGLDEWEGVFDALVTVAVDPNVQWSQHAEKVVVIITDAFGHTGDFDTLQDHVDAFNAPIQCRNGYTSGGFGAIDTTDHWIGWAPPTEHYQEYAQLKYKHVCADEDLSDEEKSRFNELAEFLEPHKFDPVLPFDRNELLKNPEYHCAHHEYPTYAQISDIMVETNTKVIVLQVDDIGRAASTEDVWTWALGSDEGLSRVPSFYAHINQGNPLQSALLQGLEQLVGDCASCDASHICPCEGNDCSCCDAVMDINLTFRGSFGKLNVHAFN